MLTVKYLTVNTSVNKQIVCFGFQLRLWPRTSGLIEEKLSSFSDNSMLQMTPNKKITMNLFCFSM